MERGGYVSLIFHRGKKWTFLLTPLVEDNNGKFQGGRVIVVGIPRGTPKIVEKTWILRGIGTKI